jgi:hypothetical protein
MPGFCPDIMVMCPDKVGHEGHTLSLNLLSEKVLDISGEGLEGD